MMELDRVKTADGEVEYGLYNCVGICYKLNKYGEVYCKCPELRGTIEKPFCKIGKDKECEE